MLGMAGEPWMQHASNLRMIFEPASDGECVAIVLLHADRQSLDAAKDEKTILRAGAGSHGVLQMADAFGERGLLHDHPSADDIGMTIDVLRCRVQNDVDAQIQRALEIGRVAAPLKH